MSRTGELLHFSTTFFLIASDEPWPQKATKSGSQYDAKAGYYAIWHMQY